MVEELKASQEKSLSQASELHVKEREVLQSQVDKLKQELSSSKDKTQELEKLVSELQPYKEQAQVSTNPQRYSSLVESTCNLLNVKWLFYVFVYDFYDINVKNHNEKCDLSFL